MRPSPVLPVPPLEPTLARYLTAVGPLLTPAGQARTRAAVEAFRTGPGPACQAELERFARVEQAQGHSWLSRAWLRSYLEVRDPLMLSTGVAFPIAWPWGPSAPAGLSGPAGLDLAAQVAHAVAGAHLAGLRGQVPPEVTGRGEAVDARQWEVVSGGVRRPRPGCDEIDPAPAGSARREIGVLWRGRCLAVPVSDSTGASVSRAALRAALAAITALPAATGPEFTDLSYLPAEQGAAHLDRLLADEPGRIAYARLRDLLCVLRLGEEPPASEAERLRRMTVEPGWTWVGKPLGYHVGLVDGSVGVVMEHSRFDGGTLAAVVEQVQRTATTTGAGVDLPGPPQEIAWRLDDTGARRLAADTAAYRRAAARYRVRIEQVAGCVPAGMRLSHDAVQQWLLLCAQLAVHGRVRSTYEAVDMRTWAAGRTECLRPNTPEAVTLVRALLTGTAGRQEVEAAAHAHRGRVKEAKAGQGIDRHLLGLHLAASRLAIRSPLHDDPAWGLLTTDFLSTTSLGDRRRLVRAGFAPTSPGGIGVYYVPSGDGYELTLSTEEGRSERVDELAGALHRASSALAAALGG